MLPKSQRTLTSMTEASIIKWNAGSERVRKSISPESLRARSSMYHSEFKTSCGCKVPRLVSYHGDIVYNELPAKPFSLPRLVKKSR